MGNLSLGHYKDRKEIKLKHNRFCFPTVTIPNRETHLFPSLHKVVEEQKQRVHGGGKVEETTCRLRIIQCLRTTTYSTLIPIGKPFIEKYMRNSKCRSSSYRGPRVSGSLSKGRMCTRDLLQGALHPWCGEDSPDTELEP